MIELAVQLAASLEARQHMDVMVAMQRAKAWHALARLLPPARIAGERQLVDLKVHRIFENVANQGNPLVLAYLWTQPPILRALREHKLLLPHPPTLLTLGSRAYRFLEEEGSTRMSPLPLPPMTSSGYEGATEDGGDHEPAASERDEVELLRWACSCLRLPFVCHGSSEEGRQRSVLAMLVIAVERGERAMRELRAVDELSSAGSSTSASSGRGSTPSLPSHHSKEARCGSVPLMEAEAIRAQEGAMDACVDLIAMMWEISRRAPPWVRQQLSAEHLLVDTGAVEWIVRTALPTHQRNDPEPKDEALHTHALLHPSLASHVEQAWALAAVRPLSSASQMPLLRAQRRAAHLLCEHVLATTHPRVMASLAALRVGEAVVSTVKQQQQELIISLSMPAPPSIFLNEYATSRRTRMCIWHSLVRAQQAVAKLLLDASAIERLIIEGGLPVMRTFAFDRIKLDPSFLPFNFQMVLRHEALEMIYLIITHSSEQPLLFQRLLQASINSEVVKTSSNIRGYHRLNVCVNVAETVTVAII